MARSRFVFLFISGFFAGILMASWGLFPPIGWSMPAALLFLSGWRRRRNIIFVVALGLWLGLLRFWLALPHFTVEDIAAYRETGKSFPIEGLIISEPDVRSDRQYIVIGAERIFWKDRWRKVDGKIRIKTLRHPQYQYGDRLEVSCLLESPHNFHILAKEGIYSVCHRASVKILARRQGNVFWSGVFTLKNALLERIKQLFPEPEASIVAGLLMGVRGTIPQRILDDFSATGLSHILAVSGYNIGIMISVFGALVSGRGRWVRFWGIFAGILLLVLFTGFSASVIRAAWMGFFAVLAKTVGRQSDGLYVLMLSGFVMVLMNPYILAFDLSFELSFLATFGLVLVMPRFEKIIEKYFSKLPKFLIESFFITLAAQLFTFPLIVYYFGTISLIAPFSNLLFLPLIPLIMMASFTASLLAFVWPPLALPLVALGWIFFKILLGGTASMARIPFGSFSF